MKNYTVESRCVTTIIIISGNFVIVSDNFTCLQIYAVSITIRIVVSIAQSVVIHSFKGCTQAMTLQ